MPNSNKRPGAVTTENSRLITLWIPHPIVAAVDAAVTAKDTDRSKWIREAIREKAAREQQPT